jgi:2-deoxy-D-gluconate 3-dehydrogenase
MDSFALDGRVALVTGASRGIGRAIALGLAGAGADVALTARTADALDDVAAEIRGFGRKALVLPADLDRRGAAEQVFGSTVDTYGAVDVVVNNAGGFDHIGPFLELSAEDWDAMLRTNLLSVVEMCRVAGAHLCRRGSGSLVNVASVGGYKGVPMLSPYAVAKAGVISLTRTLAVEWAASGVRVNAIAPGWTRTQLTSGFAGNPELAEGLIASVPAGRWGEPEDLAGAAVYLAGDAAAMVTGACITVDGGVTAYDTGPAMVDLLAAGRIPVGTD